MKANLSHHLCRLALACIPVVLSLTGCPPKAVPPQAEFSLDVTEGIAPLSVSFNDASIEGSNPVTQWQWEFGDGTTSIEQSPVHIYQDAGTYTVTLTVSNEIGGSTLRKTDVLRVKARPMAAFTATPLSGSTPLEVSFTDESVAGSAPIMQWEWDFGDGAQSQEPHPTHTYLEAGTYNVSLKVVSEIGDDTLVKEGYINTVSLPVAEFSSSNVSGEQPLFVAFADTSQPGSAPISSWSWEFGDGAVSTEQNPEHTYEDEGSYTVTLTVTTALGSDSNVKPAYIQVQPYVPDEPPSPAFSWSPSSGYAPLNVTFTDQSLPGWSAITNWSWQFGDGESSNEQNPSHLFEAPGEYTVTLTVFDGFFTESASNVISILAPIPPAAEFTSTPQAGVAPLTVQFMDASRPGSSTITSWMWDFGDGQTSTEPSPSHTFVTPGTYSVGLTVSGSSGADVEVKNNLITVSPPPVLTATRIWKLVGNNPGILFADSVAAAGDINGDGFDDAVIGTPMYDVPALTGQDHGRADLYLGSVDGLDTTSSWFDTGAVSFDWFARSLDGAGDVNGDGFDDVVVGAEEWINGGGFRGGEAKLYYGAPSGLSLDPAFTAFGPLNDPIRHMGNYVAAAGDVNADGFDDFVAGITSSSSSKLPYAEIYMGSAQGPAKDETWQGMRDAATAAGDINGDGFDDVICGTYYDYGFGGGIFAYHGGPDGLTQNATWSFLRSNTIYSAALGRRLCSAGDLNNDGFDDVLISDDGYQNEKGTVLAFHGSAEGLSASPIWSTTGGTEFRLYGSDVTGLGDINDDGFDDVAIGAIQKPDFSDCGIDERGSVLVYLGSAAGLQQTPALRLYDDCLPEGDGYRFTAFGGSLSAPLDTDQDGKPELLIGASTEVVGTVYVGAAYLYEFSMEPAP